MIMGRYEQFLRRLAHTFTGPRINYFPQLSTRRTPVATQDRRTPLQDLQGGGLQGYRNSLSEPGYKYEYRSTSPTSPRIVPAEGASPFATPDYSPARNSLADPEYAQTQPQAGRKL